MLSTGTVKVIRSNNQNFNPNIFPINSKIVNYNMNGIQPLAQAITFPQSAKPLISTNSISRQVTTIPRIRTSLSLKKYHNVNSLGGQNSIIVKRNIISQNPYNTFQNRNGNSYETYTYKNTQLQNNLHTIVTPLSMYNINPDFNIQINEFAILNLIGKGSEGVVYTVKWARNNKIYAMKKCEIQSMEDIRSREQEIITLKNYVDSTGTDGILKTYGRACLRNNFGFFDYYEIMEYADRDWEKEIARRQSSLLFYPEYEIMEILRRLVRNFSSLQTNHITHRDVKPQNIMIVNGTFKICDFGNAKILKKEGIVVQRIRGSELFMSPIVFKGYHAGMAQIQHNTFKSDVFSLGMCFFFAACLSYDGPSYIREVYDMNVIRNYLNYYLGRRYSQNFINILYTMLQVEEARRPDFNQLQMMFGL